MSHVLAHGELVVVETDDDAFLGVAEVLDAHLIVRNGFVGRPVLIPLAEVVSISPAADHASVLDEEDLRVGAGVEADMATLSSS